MNSVLMASIALLLAGCGGPHTPATQEGMDQSVDEEVLETDPAVSPVESSGDVKLVHCHDLISAGQRDPELNIEQYTDMVIGILSGDPIEGEGPYTRMALEHSLDILIDEDSLFCGLVEANPEEWR